MDFESLNGTGTHSEANVFAESRAGRFVGQLHIDSRLERAESEIKGRVGSIVDYSVVPVSHNEYFLKFFRLSFVMSLALRHFQKLFKGKQFFKREIALNLDFNRLSRL
jgi:hypothetical protein